MKLSIIIPVFNEEKTIAELIKRVEAAAQKLEKEIIVVDDGSTDATKKCLQKIKQGKDNIVVLSHAKNFGKGRAIRTALNYANGEIIIIQDADLEYDPQDYPRLIQPILDGRAKVVYGSRNLNANQTGKRLYKWGGQFLSTLTNLLYGTNLTDEATGYKIFKAEIIKGVNLASDRFGFCPEVTAKISKKKISIVEVPITYNPRNHEQGKKVRIKDGLEAVWLLIKYRFTD